MVACLSGIIKLARLVTGLSQTGWTHFSHFGAQTVDLQRVGGLPQGEQFSLFVGCDGLQPTHDMHLVQELFPRMIIMDQGRIIADGKTDHLLQDVALLEAHGLEAPTR
jgi:hypothetical protein